MKPFILTLVALISCLPTHGAADSERLDLLRKAKRVVFLGDSITAAGTYTANFATWAAIEHPEWKPDWLNLGLASETVSGLSEDGHAGGRFPRPDLHERLSRVLTQTKPDLVFACYGMNCGIYQPLDETRFSAYRDGIRKLKNEVEKTGATIIFLTPPYYDSLRRPKNDHYTGVLENYSKWLLDQRREGWQVIDLNSHMKSAVEAGRQGNPGFTLQPDGVHPKAQGHWVMAQAMIAWFGDKKSAQADSAAAMVENSGKPVEVLQLVTQRMTVLHDAWLTATKHKRPGVRAGKPLPEAQKIAQSLTQEIDRLTQP